MRYSLSITAAAALLLAGTVCAAQPPAPAASTAAPKLSPADQKRVMAIEQYQHDLVNVVALRADPSFLLGAAILARPFEQQTPGLDFDALSARAADAPHAGPAIDWARLDACKDKSDCPNAAAFAALKKLAADNAAVWLVEMDLATDHKDTKAARAALKKAAAATSYDDYYGKALAGVANAVSVLPPLPDTTAGAHDGQPDNPEGVRLFVSFNATQAHPRPDLGPLVELCDKDADAKADCLKLAHTLQWGSSPIARAVGLHIQAGLDPDSQSRDQQASRNLAWQVKQYSGIVQHALTDPTLASQWLTAARNGGTELSLILATLRANQVSLDAPAEDAAPAGAASSGQ